MNMMSLENNQYALDNKDQSLIIFHQQHDMEWSSMTNDLSSEFQALKKFLCILLMLLFSCRPCLETSLRG